MRININTQNTIRPRITQWRHVKSRDHTLTKAPKLLIIVNHGSHFWQLAIHRRIKQTHVTVLRTVLWKHYATGEFFVVFYWDSIPINFACSISSPARVPAKQHPWQQGLWGQHGTHLGPTGPRWAPCWPHELRHLGLRNMGKYITWIDLKLQYDQNKTQPN